MLGMAGLAVIVPFLLLVSQSLMTEAEFAMHGFRLVPRRVTFEAYRYILLETPVVRNGFYNSIVLVAAGTTINLVLTFLTSYPLSKRYLRYRSVLTWVVFLPMLFSGGLIPLYLVVTSLGLNGTIWAVVAVTAISSWNVFLMRNFFAEIPETMEEAARMDGATEMTTLLRIYLPLSAPAIATIGLFYGVAHWNSWFYPGIFLRTKYQWPLQVVLRELVYSLDMRLMGFEAGRGDALLRFVPKEGIKTAAIIVSAIPILIIYPFLQRHFVKGVMVGAIKG